jgi:hypothetical protein
MVDGRKNIVIYIGLFVAAVLIGAYGIFLNKGALVVTGHAPYTLHVDQEVMGCGEDVCEMELAPGVYTARVIKEGYHDEAFDVVIERWKDFTYEADVRFIPVLNNVDVIERLHDGVGVFTLRDDGVLFRNGGTAAEAGQVTVFQDPLGNPVVVPSADEQYALVYELVDGGMIAYVVNGKLMQKQRVLVREGVTRAEWGPFPWLLFEDDEGVFVLNSETLEEQRLGVEALNQVAAFEASLLFVGLGDDKLTFYEYDMTEEVTAEIISLEGAATLPNEMVDVGDGSLYFRIGEEAWSLRLRR